MFIIKLQTLSHLNFKRHMTSSTSNAHLPCILISCTYILASTISPSMFTQNIDCRCCLCWNIVRFVGLCNGLGVKINTHQQTYFNVVEFLNLDKIIMKYWFFGSIWWECFPMICSIVIWLFWLKWHITISTNNIGGVWNYAQKYIGINYVVNFDSLEKNILFATTCD